MKEKKSATKLQKQIMPGGGRPSKLAKLAPSQRITSITNKVGRDLSLAASSAIKRPETITYPASQPPQAPPQGPLVGEWFKGSLVALTCSVPNLLGQSDAAQQ
jgi:hypothetical protein